MEEKIVVGGQTFEVIAVDREEARDVKGRMLIDLGNGFKADMDAETGRFILDHAVDLPPGYCGTVCLLFPNWRPNSLGCFAGILHGKNGWFRGTFTDCQRGFFPAGRFVRRSA